MKKILLGISLITLTACHHHNGIPCHVYEEKAKTPIYFGFDSVEMTPESKTIVDDGLVYLTNHRFRKIQLDGWADEQGGESQYNTDLSIRRAIAVRDYMVDNGVRENRITIQGNGVSHGTPYKKHRRVNVTIK